MLCRMVRCLQHDIQQHPVYKGSIVPTVSIDANVSPPQSSVKSGAADRRDSVQRDLDQPPQFASFLSAQTAPPPPAVKDNPPASSPRGQADTPPRQAADSPSPAVSQQPAGTVEPSSDKEKRVAGATPVATDRTAGIIAKIVPKAAVLASAGPALPAAATRPAQPPAAKVAVANMLSAETPPATETGAAVVADGTDGTGASSSTDGPDTDTKRKAANDKHVAVDDAATQIVTTPDPSNQNPQPSPNAAAPAIAENPQVAAAIAPVQTVQTMPTAGAEPSANASANDPLTIAVDAPAATGRPLPASGPPKPVSAASIPSADVEAPLTTDTPGKPATPNGGGAPSHKTNVIPPNEAAAPPTAAAKLVASPAQETEQTPTVATANINLPAAPADTGVEPDGRAREAIKPPDPSGNSGLVVQTQTVSAPSSAAIVSSVAPTPPNQSTSAPVPVAEVGVTIAMLAQSGKSRFEIRLDPPELGRIDVQLNVDSRGTVSSRLIVERPDTLNLLVRDAPQLQRALQDAGLNTAGGMQFSLADQGFANRDGFARQNEFASPREGGGMAGDTVPIAALQGYVAWSGRNGGLDITV